MAIRHGGGSVATLAGGYLVVYLIVVATSGPVSTMGFTDPETVLTALIWQPDNAMYWLYVASVAVVVHYVGRRRYRRYAARRSR